MISCETSWILLTCMAVGLAFASATCPSSPLWNGVWIQPGLSDTVTINQTWFSSKGTCLSGQQDVKTKYIYYNEHTRCKRCILFIPRHPNALQYRESECFDADEDDNGRICASITPDTVLYTLFRNNVESIPCPLSQSWYFKKEYQLSSTCQPKAFHYCSTIDTFQLSYSAQCSTKQDVIATCFAQFSDGNMNYVVSRRAHSGHFVCFSYIKTKSHGQHSVPTEVYLSQDEACRDLFTRESTMVLKVIPNQPMESQVQLPDWTKGTWLSVGTSAADSYRVSINETHLLMITIDDRVIEHDLTFLRVMPSRQQRANRIRIRSKSLHHCSSRFYCLKLVYRSSTVMDLSIAYELLKVEMNKLTFRVLRTRKRRFRMQNCSDEYRCNENGTHYTLFKPATNYSTSCPQHGIYKSFGTYRSALPVSTCSAGPQMLSIGCEMTNHSELVLSSTCRHDAVPDIQVITAVNAVCLASWRTDRRFQRTLVLYEKKRAFCLIQPLKSMTASWILFEHSCTHFDPLSIHVQNSFRYSSTCHPNTRLLSLSSSSSSRTIPLFSFHFVLSVIIHVTVMK